jgi:hypothetical protein
MIDLLRKVGLPVAAVVVLVAVNAPGWGTGSAAGSRHVKVSAHVARPASLDPAPEELTKPLPVPGVSGAYYVTCYAVDVTAACRAIFTVEPLPGATKRDAGWSMTFACRPPRCHYKQFAKAMAHVGRSRSRPR